MEFLEELKNYMSELEERLNTADNKETLVKIEKLLKNKLPEEFKLLYSICDGEKDEPFTGMILGFSLMSSKDILENLQEFRKYNSEEFGKLVPFAWDGSRCYICIDMSAKEKLGQIVALDFDYDRCTPISDNIEKFWKFNIDMLKDGKLAIDNEKQCFVFETGHFFNIMEDILLVYNGNASEVKMVELPEVFWREYFNAKSVSVTTLQKVRDIMISEGEMTISLEPVTYMTNLNELIIHSCTFSDFEKISQATEIKKLHLASCNMKEEDLEVLSKLPKLKSITLGRMPFTDISILTHIKALKNLRLYHMHNMDASKLEAFSKLTEIDIEGTDIGNLEFLKGCKALKKLKVSYDTRLENLDFLQYVKKLKEFEYTRKIKDETGLKFIKELPQLVTFMYPVSDMELYADCEKLQEIGIDAIGFRNPQALDNSKIESITICNADSEEQAEEVIEILEEILDLRSCGMTGDFLEF